MFIDLIPKLRIKPLYFESKIINWFTDWENSCEIFINLGIKSVLGWVHYIIILANQNIFFSHHNFRLKFP